MRVFISHSSVDNALALEFAAGLREDGYETWLDLEDIRPGEDYPAAIMAGLEGSDAVLILLGADAMRSKDVEREFIRAEQLGSILVPILLPDAPDPLRHHSWAYHLTNVQYTPYRWSVADTLRAVRPSLLRAELGETNKKFRKRQKKAARRVLLDATVLTRYHPLTLIVGASLSLLLVVGGTLGVSWVYSGGLGAALPFAEGHQTLIESGSRWTAATTKADALRDLQWYDSPNPPATFEDDAQVRAWHEAEVAAAAAHRLAWLEVEAEAAEAQNAADRARSVVAGESARAWQAFGLALGIQVVSVLLVGGLLRQVRVRLPVIPVALNLVSIVGIAALTALSMIETGFALAQVDFGIWALTPLSAGNPGVVFGHEMWVLLVGTGIVLGLVLLIATLQFRIGRTAGMR